MNRDTSHPTPRPAPPSIRTAMGKFTFGADFDLREQVHIDGDTSIKATIVALIFYDGRTQYQCAYMHNGAAYEPWIDRWRLTRCS